MIVSKRRINAQNQLLDSLDQELTDLKDNYQKCLHRWNSDIEEMIFAKRKEIEAEETKLAEMEAIYEGREVEKQKPWEKKRGEASLLSFC